MDHFAFGVPRIFKSNQFISILVLNCFITHQLTLSHKKIVCIINNLDGIVLSISSGKLRQVCGI